MKTIQEYATEQELQRKAFAERYKDYVKQKELEVVQKKKAEKERIEQFNKSMDLSASDIEYARLLKLINHLGIKKRR